MDDTLSDLTASEIGEVDSPDLNKMTMTCIMLKKRISESHELIKQYNDKVKECDRLKHDLDAAKKQVHKITCNHNSTLAKVIKLELQNTEYKKSNESLSTQVQDHSVKAAADQQHIQQLICKIKDLEGKENEKILQYDIEKSSLQVKVKELEQELKSVKKSHDTKIKRIEKKHTAENENKPKVKDAEVNTEPIKETVIKKPKLVDKYISTDEIYNVKSNVYPIYCDKCEIVIRPPPLERICKMMSDSCPKLIEKIVSPKKRSLQISTDINSDEYKGENAQLLTTSRSPNIQNRSNADFVSPNLLSSQRIPLNRADYSNFSLTHNSMNHGPYYGSTPINQSMSNSSNVNSNNHCEKSIATIASSLSIIPWFQEKVDTLEAKVSVLEEKLRKKKSRQDSACCNYHSNSPHGYDLNNSGQTNMLELWKEMADFFKNNRIEDECVHKKKPESRVKRKKAESMRSGSWNVEPISKRTDSTPVEKSNKSKHRSKSNSPKNVAEDLGNLDSASDVDTRADLFNYDSLESEDLQRVKPSSVSNAENTNTLECGKSVGGETDSGILSDSLQPESDMDLAEPRNTVETMSSVQRLHCIRDMKSKLVNKPLIKVVSNLAESDKFIEKNTVEVPVDESEPISHTQEHDNRTEEIENDNLVCTKVTRKRKISEGREVKKSGGRQKLLEKIRSLRKTSRIEACSKTLQCPNLNGNSCTDQEQAELRAEDNDEDDYLPKKKPRIAHVPKSTAEQKSPQLKKRLVQKVENDIQNTSDNCDINKLDDTEKSPQSKKQLVKNVENGIQNSSDNCNTNKLDNTVNRDSNILNDTENHDSNNILDIPENRADQDVVNCNTENVVMDTDPIISDTANSFNDVQDRTVIDNSKVLNESIEINTKWNNNVIKQELEINCSNISQVEETEQQSSELHSPSTSEMFDIKNINISPDIINYITTARKDSCTGCEKNIIETPLMRLQQHVARSPTSSKAKHKKTLPRIRLADEFVKKQLQRLASSDWQNSVHWDVIEKLKSTSSARIIAKGIIEFMSTEEEDSEPLDKSHTPPAPLMTKTQQKIVTLLVDLEEQKPELFHLVQAGIEYKLFRLNQTLTRSVVESLSRIYTVLARIKKDRKRVRSFCCDALYCLGLNVVCVLYIVLTSWPEIFPNSQTNSRPLPRCIAHLLLSIQAVNFPKLNSLKNLLSVYYKYPMGSVSTEILSELLTLFQEKCDTEVETAIILLAKREGTTWTYTNVIKGALLPMIINNKLPSSYRAFSLLGNLMRVFPIEDKDNLVGEIVAQLCDLINSGEGSDEQKEGVFSALLSLSRHKFDTVVANTVKWVPSAPLHDRTIQQINGMFNLRPVEYWRNYIRKNKLLPSTQKKSKT